MMQLIVRKKLMNFNYHKKNMNQEGIALVETIAALGLAVVVITALVSLSIFTLRSASRGKLLLQGSKLASEQLELVRAYRNANPWSTFVTAVQSCDGTPYCYMTISGPPYTLAVGSGSEYAYALDSSGQSTEGTPIETAYWFTVSDPINGDAVTVSDNVVEIKVTVQWRLGPELKTTTIYTNVSNWRDQ